MKTLIVYISTHNGNTRKIAEAMAEELQADIFSADELKNLDVSAYDLVGLGSGVYFGRHHASIMNLAEKLRGAKNKRFFIFSTSGSPEGFFNGFNGPLKKRLSLKGARVVGAFNCPGFDNAAPFKYFGGKNKGRPNESDIAAAKSFAASLKPQPLTLAIVAEDGKILLGMKKRGWGEGRWNGFGGKLKEGEDVAEAAKREFFEESKVVASDVCELGLLCFDYLDTNDYMEVHVFRVNDFFGEPEETEEMKPRWFYFDEIPFEKMWPDDSYWLPLLLQGRKFKGKFLFENKDKIVEKILEQDE